MIEMSPFYAYASEVGPVFDVATWSPRKAFTMAIVGLLVGSACAVATAYVWDPSLFAADPPQWLKELNQELAKANKQYPWAVLGGTGLLALFAFIFLVGAVSCVADLFRADYYFRAGPGGLSLRVPTGVSLTTLGLRSNPLVLDLHWDEIADWKIVQHKQIGSLSANAGNLDAHFWLRIVDGRKHQFSLDLFREPARIIHSKIRDAIQMVPARFGPEEPPATGAEAPAPEDEYTATYTDA
jgi:hypothetical protein